jgi:hypothetical protein
MDAIDCAYEISKVLQEFSDCAIEMPDYMTMLPKMTWVPSITLHYKDRQVFNRIADRYDLTVYASDDHAYAQFSAGKTQISWSPSKD